MRKTLLTILVSTLLITNALAADDGNCAECIKLDKSTLPAGGQNLASLDKATRAIEVENGPIINKKALRKICGYAEMKNFKKMMREIERVNLSLAENYLDIDCSKTGRVGPTFFI